METLPPETLRNILSFVEIESLAATALTCHMWQSILLEHREYFSKLHLRKLYGSGWKDDYKNSWYETLQLLIHLEVSFGDRVQLVRDKRQLPVVFPGLIENFVYREYDLILVVEDCEVPCIVLDGKISEYNAATMLKAAKHFTWRNFIQNRSYFDNIKCFSCDGYDTFIFDYPGRTYDVYSCLAMSSARIISSRLNPVTVLAPTIFSFCEKGDTVLLARRGSSHFVTL